MYCKCYSKIGKKKLFGVLNPIFLAPLMLILLNNEQQEAVATLHVSCNLGCSYEPKKEKNEHFENPKNFGSTKIILFFQT